jgi:hypothetical protein
VKFELFTPYHFTKNPAATFLAAWLYQQEGGKRT